MFGNELNRIARKTTAKEFLADVSSNGLLVERENGFYASAHHTFQEYLAANFIRDRGNVQVLLDNVNDTWWRETTLLYTARSDADAIARACIEMTSVVALSLAFETVRTTSRTQVCTNSITRKIYFLFRQHAPRSAPGRSGGVRTGRQTGDRHLATGPGRVHQVGQRDDGLREEIPATDPG